MRQDKSIDGEEDEGIEGLQETFEGSWGDYPLDTLLIRTETRTVFEVVRRINGETFVLDPDFQRDFIWPENKQSKLIESVLMRIPLPVFYLAEDEKGRMIVVDGLQRLSTFKRFLENKLRLKLPWQPELHGKRFNDLAAKLQNRVEDCNLVLYVIDAKVPEQARLDIFDRVNSGEPLTRQQMRNCLYTGRATRFLKQEAGTDLFVKATGNSLRTGTMRDREFVNRFVSFHLLPLEFYNRDIDEFLARGLTTLNSMNEVDIENLSKSLRIALSNNWNVFGKHAFRKHSKGDTDRGLLNASLWDVMSTGLTCYSEDLVTARADSLRKGFFELMGNDEFVKSITYSVTGTKQVKTRFKLAKTMFREVFGADKA
jgi:hypothetical protein